MYEEELADIRHTDLLIRFAEACGTTRERIEDPNNANAVTRGLQGWCYATSMREHFAVATAALVVGLESQVPSIYKKQIVPLREAYGFTEDEIEFFDLHITSDEVHGERGYQIVLENADTPELQQRCLQFVRWGAEMRFSYTRALYDTYVAPDLGRGRRRRGPGRRAARLRLTARLAAAALKLRSRKGRHVDEWHEVGRVRDLELRKRAAVTVGAPRSRCSGSRGRSTRSLTPASTSSASSARARSCSGRWSARGTSGSSTPRPARPRARTGAAGLPRASHRGRHRAGLPRPGGGVRRDVPRWCWSAAARLGASPRGRCADAGTTAGSWWSARRTTVPTSGRRCPRSTSLPATTPSLELLPVGVDRRERRRGAHRNVER